MVDELVDRLSRDKHEIVIGHRDESDKELQKRIEDGYIHIKFTQTKGCTELGLNLDKQLSQIEDANFETGQGNLKIRGTCELNFHKVRCVADVDLATRRGVGYLELLDN